MRASDHLRNVQHVGGNVLQLTYADGFVKRVDFGPWLNAPERTPYQKRYRASQWFKRFRMLDTHAIMWGDYLMVFAADKMRKGLSPPNAFA